MRTLYAAMVIAAASLCACAAPFTPIPDGLAASVGSIESHYYDGVTDDLLTAGLGSAGLGALLAPAFADPLQPTAAELRRNAIFNNYRAIVDINPLSGYGSLYGPGERLVAGTEYLAYDDDGSGRRNVTLMVQLPDSFDVRQPCIVAGASSGSSGIYGAMATAGEWGLKQGCAVAYADKGTGTGLYTFDDDSVNRRNGVRASREAAGKSAIFAPGLDAAGRAAFAARYPDRLAFKHAHSLQNPEAQWGDAVLHAVGLAFHVLRARYPAAQLAPANTIVIAASISNGGGAALRAVERDAGGLIDGVVVSEPQVQVGGAGRLVVMQGGAAVPAMGKALLDYASLAALYEPCLAGSAGRCATLALKGLVHPLQPLADAHARMLAYGWSDDAGDLIAAHAATNALIAVTYAYAYGRFPVQEALCGFTFASVDIFGLPAPLSAARRAQSFANQSGIPGNIVYEAALGGPHAWQFAISPTSSMADQALDGFLCLRALVTGKDAVSGVPLAGEALARSDRVRRGMAEVQATGNLRGRPAILVQGRSDAMVPANHGARAYGALNALVEGDRSRLSYVEVTNANHFDIFSSVTPTAIVPLNLYFHRALDAMHAHLAHGAPLPPSQLVRTVTRASGMVPMSENNVPPIAARVGEGDAIRIGPGRIEIPH